MSKNFYYCFTHVICIYFFNYKLYEFIEDIDTWMYIFLECSYKGETYSLSIIASYNNG